MLLALIAPFCRFVYLVFCYFPAEIRKIPLKEKRFPRRCAPRAALPENTARNATPRRKIAKKQGIVRCYQNRTLNLRIPGELGDGGLQREGGAGRFLKILRTAYGQTASIVQAGAL
jgi:hypothetical protein